MDRCLAVAMQAADRGEYPYAAVICRLGQIVCEATSSVRQDHDATHHAELLAITRAYRRLDRVSLEDCTIYSNAEPCALCSYAIRESRIGRVVYGIPAPLTGGMTRWNILADNELSDRLPEVFVPPPQIAAGFMREQIESTIALRYPVALARSTIRSQRRRRWQSLRRSSLRQRIATSMNGIASWWSIQALISSSRRFRARR